MAFAPVQPGGIIQAPTINNLVSAIDWFSADTGVVNAHKVTFNGVTGSNMNNITVLTDGLTIAFRAALANTAAATLEVIGGSGTLGTRAITKNGGTALVSGDIQLGQIVVVIYNLTSTRFEMQNATRVAATSITTGTLPVARGGTGLAAFALGSFPYASAANVLSARTIGTAGQVLGVSGGLPTWVNAGTTRGVQLITTNSTSLTTAVNTVNAAWTSASWQTDAGYWASGNAITIPAGLGGKYFVKAIVQFPAFAAATLISMELNVGGVGSAIISEQRQIPASPSPTILSVCAVLNLAATNTLTFKCLQSSGATVATVAAGTMMQAVLLGL